MKKVIFRADAGQSIGFGHFIRSLALASYLKNDFNCFFCSFNPLNPQLSNYQIQEIVKVAKPLHWATFSQKDYDNIFLENLNGDEIVVLDNYYFSTEFQQKIKDKGCKLVCIDDIHDREMVCDVLMTGCPLPKSLFRIPDSSKFLGGLKYSFLRPPFFNIPEREKKGFNPFIKDREAQIVLAVGGADPYNLTNKIIPVLLSSHYKFHLSVIAGDTVNIDSQFLNEVKIYSRLTAEEIVRLFANSDLGIFPASTISVEAIACKLPVAAFWYVDNQKELYDFGVERHLFYPLSNPLVNFGEFKTNLLGIFENIIQINHEINFSEGMQEIIEVFKNL